MNWKLFSVIITGLCVLLFAIQSYNGQQVPAWVAMIWCGAVFIKDIEAYLEGR